MYADDLWLLLSNSWSYASISANQMQYLLALVYFSTRILLILYKIL